MHNNQILSRNGKPGLVVKKSRKIRKRFNEEGKEYFQPCHYCGRRGHYGYDCPTLRTKYEQKIRYQYNIKCHTCKTYGHLANDCPNRIRLVHTYSPEQIRKERSYENKKRKHSDRQKRKKKRSFSTSV